MWVVTKKLRPAGTHNRPLLRPPVVVNLRQVQESESCPKVNCLDVELSSRFHLVVHRETIFGFFSLSQYHHFQDSSTLVHENVLSYIEMVIKPSKNVLSYIEMAIKPSIRRSQRSRPIVDHLIHGIFQTEHEKVSYTFGTKLYLTLPNCQLLSWTVPP